MQIKELFTKPLYRQINGVVKADQADAETVYQELDEYVVTNELERHFRTFFESYGTDLKDPSIANRVGIWISGFFGSGKSHFLKILSYLLANIESHDDEGSKKKAVQFFDQSKLRDAMIRADLAKAVATPADVILFNIDSKASSNDAGNPLLNVFLRVFNESQGFSADHPHIAHMERHLAEKGVYEQFKQSFKDDTGASWEAERDGYQFHQDAIENAISKALGLSGEAAHKWFEQSETTFSVSVENFCKWVKEYLDSRSPSHRMLFLVDEVGQFIGSDTRLMLTLQTLTENLGTICKGRAWIIVTSQADMDAVLGELTANKANDFSRLAGRFKTRLSLSSSNTDEVIQKRLLEKTAAAAAELHAIYESKGEILKNQLTFDRTGPTLKNYDSPDSFVRNYPFAPYHFQLVQKVFEEIRKVGATGAHLAFGERSMLDAFQLAAQSIADKSTGALVPLHSFYRAVEGFLDPAVKRTIDQAGENNSLDAFDVEILRLLFMIRYVDLIKGTTDNLVTLSITTVDEDKLVLRKRLEDTLQRLEKESLITRNGDEFLFLTNEERDITRKIKATDIASQEENKELAAFIYKDLLKDKNKFRYFINKTDYNIGRYLDSHAVDARYDGDLRIEVISPLSPDYSIYTDTGCINRSGDAGGAVLIKLPDDKDFFRELRTWLQTNKFIRLNDDGSHFDISRILTDRGRENQERRKRLRLKLEEMLTRAEGYALGQHLKLSTGSLVTRFDEACQYLLENTFTKLNYLKVLQENPERELHATLHADDIGQLGLTLDGEQGNPLAHKEVEQYVSLRTGANERVLVSDIVERFTARPYGWPDMEILIILARLAAMGKVSFHTDGPSLTLPATFEYLTKTHRRKEISVQRKRQTDEAILKQARSLSQELFNALGPATEKELFAFFREHLQQWRNNLKSYRSKTEVGRFPGQKVIDDSLLQLERLLRNDDSFEFFKAAIEQRDVLLDLEEDYRDLHEFFTNQLHTWHQLQAALRQFEGNQQVLKQDAQASSALDHLRQIESSAAPYNQLHRVAALIEQVSGVNQRIIGEHQQQAVESVDSRIAQLRTAIDTSGVATADLSNQLLRPLQLLKEQIQTETTVAGIHLLESRTLHELLEESADGLELAIAASIAAKTPAAKGGSNENVVKEPSVQRPVVDIQPSRIFSQTCKGLYLETEEDVQRFLTQLKQELQQALASSGRIRIR